MLADNRTAVLTTSIMAERSAGYSGEHKDRALTLRPRNIFNR
jgi:hypothetical protein